MTAPKKGDRVRVDLPASLTNAQVISAVLEGRVTATYGPREFDIGTGDAANTIASAADHVVSVEVLPPPEPEWQPGDVVRSATGTVFRRTNEGVWEAFGTANRYGHGVLPRPLTRLVPEATS